MNEVTLILTNEDEIKKYIKASESYHNNREPIKAEYYINKAFKIAIKSTINQDLFGQILNDKAISALRRKLFKEAKKYFEEAIKIKKSNPDIKHYSIEVSLNGFAQVSKFTGDYESSLNSLNEAITLAKPNKSKYLATHYFDLARIQKITNKSRQALQTYQKSIYTAKKNIKQKKTEKHKFYEQIIYNCYNDLSEIELSNDNLQQAKQNHQQALQVLKDSKSPISTFFEAYKRFEIPAKMLVHQKDYNKAIDLFNKSKEAIIEEYQGFEAGKDLANIIHQIGECHTKLDEHEKALDIYQDAVKAVCNNFKPNTIEELPISEKIYNKRSAVASLSYKAAIWLQLFELKKEKSHILQAYNTYKLIAELLPLTRRDYIEENSKFQLADETNGIYEKAIKTCLYLHQITSNKLYLQAAFQFSESSKGIVLQEKLQADFALKGIENSVQQKDTDFKSKIAFYQSSINTNKATKGNTEQLENWESELWNCKEAYERFQQKIGKEHPNYYMVKYARSENSIVQLQKKLKADSVIIEYFTGGDRLYVFVITKNRYIVHKAEMCSLQQVKDIQLFKKLIHQFNKRGSLADYEKFKILAYQLYKKLLEPALLNLDQSINRLIIIPDGLLHHLTFEALLTSKVNHYPSAYYHPKNLDYVCNRYAVSYYYSAALLLNTTNFGNSQYTNLFAGFAPQLDDLHHNQIEAQQISANFKGQLFLDATASIDNFKVQATQSQIIHLATHATCNDENSNLSGIQFNDNEYIYNSAIENMKITSTLVVLSACETGTGFIQSGEGAMSLARAFFVAGCPALVASLWRANDKSTAKIMLYFYAYLKKGATKDVALQQAKLQFCAEAGLLESHPFYWAGFVQYGNRRSLFEESK